MIAVSFCFPKIIEFFASLFDSNVEIEWVFSLIYKLYHNERNRMKYDLLEVETMKLVNINITCEEFWNTIVNDWALSFFINTLKW